jgi:hypothetical protein
MQQGAIQYLPATGRALVVADLHGEKEYLLSAMHRSTFDVRSDTLVFLGDAVDSIRKTDDLPLVRMLLDMRMRNPDRIIYLKGNHEWESVLRYRHDMDHDSRFAFWSKMDSMTLHTFERLPYMAQSQNGFLFAHHGPLQTLTKERLESYVETNSIENSLGARLFYDADKEKAQLDSMLTAFGAEYFITGHQFARSFDTIFPNWGRLGTIHSSRPSALLIDLEKRYTSLDEIQVLNLE